MGSQACLYNAKSHLSTERHGAYMNRMVKRAVALSRRNSEWFAANKNKPQQQTNEVNNENKEV
jgi:hypothetical protein